MPWKQRRRRSIRLVGSIFGIAIGAIITAFAVQAFIVQTGLGGSGIGGIALLIYYKWGFPIALVTLLLNIPLLILGWRGVDKNFIIKTLVGLGFFTLFLSLFKGIHPLSMDDYFLGALYGGIIGGLGGGIVFRSGGSLGGTDIIAKVLLRKFGLGMGTSQLYLNSIIILASWAILGSEKALYTVVSIFVSGRMLDTILAGIPAKAVTIISGEAPGLIEHILNDIGRGATIMTGRGAYSNDAKEVIVCVVNLVEVGRLKQAVRDVDPDAFMIVQNASEIVGRGFVPKE
ncbi:MAG: YitT family protein [Desulfitobacteriaceae bacterium]